jgi:hypothetical protein
MVRVLGNTLPLGLSVTVLQVVFGINQVDEEVAFVDIPEEALFIGASNKLMSCELIKNKSLKVSVIVSSPCALSITVSESVVVISSVFLQEDTIVKQARHANPK